MRNMGTGSLLHSHSVCVLQNKTIRSSLGVRVSLFCYAVLGLGLRLALGSKLGLGIGLGLGLGLRARVQISALG